MAEGVRGVPAVVVVGAQWGDEGKGKITDVLSEQADMVVRYQGGPNAGHTVVVGGARYRLHMIPSGILHGKVCVIGNGCVIEPLQLLEEMERLHAQGFRTEGRLFISDAAHVILPYHVRLDELQERRRGDQRLGTTLRGIGPAYQDKAARVGIRVAEWLDADVFRERLARNLEQVNSLLERVYGAEPVRLEDVLERYAPAAERLRPYVTDTSVLINEALDRGRRVVFEGAQGTMLDLDHGTYPFVTSSYPTAGGACIGSGVGPTRIDYVIGVAKAYTSRVGDGPFPTELQGDLAERIRERGREYGTTTGRPRRVGWLDGVVLRYAARVSGLSALALMHLDVLGGLDAVYIASAYECDGQRYEWVPRNARVLARCRPVYEELPGWPEQLGEVRRFDELPENARRYVQRVEEIAGVPVALVSVGPERSQTLARRDVFAEAAAARAGAAR